MSKTTTPAFNSKLNWLLVVPAVLLFLNFAYLHFLFQAFFQTGLLLFFLLLLLYIPQQRYLYQLHPTRNLLKKQLLIILAALLLPILAVILGDYAGAAQYSVHPDGLGIDLLTGIYPGETLCFIVLYAITISNAVYINAVSKKSDGTTHKGLVAIGNAFYIIGFILIATISWWIATIISSLHQPGNE